MPAPDQSYAAGFIGIVTAAGVDWNVTEWTLTFATEWAETTNTSNYDAVSGRCWESSIPTTCRGNGSFTCLLDLNSLPFGVLEDGKVVAANFTAQVGKSIAGPLAIESMEIRQGGVKGVVSVTFNFHTAGLITFPLPVTPP